MCYMYYFNFSLYLLGWRRYYLEVFKRTISAYVSSLPLRLVLKSVLFFENNLIKWVSQTRYFTFFTPSLTRRAAVAWLIFFLIKKGKLLSFIFNLRITIAEDRDLAYFYNFCLFDSSESIILSNFKRSVTYISYITQYSYIFYTFFKGVLIAALVGIYLGLYLVYFTRVVWLKQISIWFLVGLLVIWFFSGFNFFLKRYKFGKFTSAIQRFC